jgi:four helix bundle protein
LSARSRIGTRHAAQIAVAVRDFRGLVCWQLSRELKCEVFDFTSEGPASHDFKFRDQIRDSSASAPRNIAEGFGRFIPGEFAQYLRWARASLMETQNHLIDAHDRRYLSDRLFSRLSNLAAAALKTTTNLMRTKQRQARERGHGRNARKGPASTARRLGEGR